MGNVRYLDGDGFFNVPHIPIRVMIDEQKAGGRDYHTHSFYEFVYIHQGVSTHYYNNTTSLLIPGDIFGIRPGDVHGYIYPNNTILYNCLFNLEIIENEMEQIGKLAGVAPILNISEPSVWQRINLEPIERKEAVAYLERMKWEGETRNMGWELKLKSLLIEFLVLFSRACENQYNQGEIGDYKYVEYIYKALDFIERNYTRGILVEEIAAFIGLSTDYFSRMFKQFTGLSPLEYIKNVRLAKATELLRYPNMSIAQVAIEVGFEDPGYFARQFRQTLGISPSGYQKESHIRRP